MTELPINSPNTFGAANTNAGAEEMTIIDMLADAPSPQPGRPRPAVQRLAQADGVNVIAFNFAPGQDLPDHKAAHPITVQCLSGSLDFTCEDKTVHLRPGMVLHLPAYLPHRVDCPERTAPPTDNILLLMMHTGEVPNKH
ncbi:cupin domain-containing protein [Corynebacterium incognita]|uniref:Cupin domain-containing protein n=1 Tax=Corynebacterium incognita TaxID=2754725 RepID=A0A7G7CQC8_9CORY|nr:cupin domain-containing protein [Corynebacterium incognita]QNE89794.1 cupin domain-containing protein [Corynebacterium incognita]